jgi:type II/III secretion system protein
MLPLAVGCLSALGLEAQRGVPSLPPELPVIRLDGLPGGFDVLSRAPQRPAPMPSFPVVQLDERGRDAGLDAVRGLSMTFARPLPVRDLVMLLFRGTPFSVVLDPGVSGTFVGELKEVTLRQALEAALFPAALDYDFDGSVLRVFPRRPQTRFFSVDHLSLPRAGMDFFAELGAGVQAILSGTGTYHVDRKAALVQATDFADRLDTIAAYLETAHLRVNRQVRLQARVFEVARADAAPIEWAALAARPRSGVRSAPGGAAGWRIDDFDAFLRTVAETGVLRHIAAPVLLAMNNEPAILRAEDAAAQTELRLTVTPHIAADGIIHMQIAPSYIAGRRVVTGAGDAGTQFTASIDTVVRVSDGDTVAVGGLLRGDTASHAELVVLLTVTTVTPVTAGSDQPSARSPERQ